MTARRNNLINPTLGVGLIVIGVVFLFQLLFQQWFHVWSLWPVLILMPGATLLYMALDGKRGGASGNAALAVPGVLVTGTGAILLYQSLTGNWASWAYVWTLYPALLGAGLWLMGRRNGNVDTMRTGRKAVIGGMAAFVVLGLLFTGFGSWWLILLLWGGWMVWRSTRK